jgi:hypothetical protein
MGGRYIPYDEYMEILRKDLKEFYCWDENKKNACKGIFLLS